MILVCMELKDAVAFADTSSFERKLGGEIEQLPDDEDSSYFLQEENSQTLTKYKVGSEEWSHMEQCLNLSEPLQVKKDLKSNFK